MHNKLNTANHDRDVVGKTYVYPVVSRRAGGVSVGINLNPNNACTWHCAYCQVPNLVRGVAPDIDLDLLRAELSSMLEEIQYGSFMQERVPEGSRQLCDVAISGNGEPTSCAAFDEVMAVIVEVMHHFELAVPLRLITNGSYVHKTHVQHGLLLMAAHHGEVWIKVDSVTDEGIERINGIKLNAARLRQQVESVARVCPTWIQTCYLAWDGQPPSEHEIAAYIDFLEALKKDDVPVQGVLLYGLARPSLQEESSHLQKLDAEWMELVAGRIARSGFEVRLSL
ncbi:MAG: radical SAM protein [Zetaproteobacteria bacterium CG1_02_53_45]|nr:MAG: radical SAM protein [Zetaproteobacteria bacterium CG1_02_53_45]